MPGLVASLVLILPAILFGILAYIPLVLMQISLMQSNNPDPSLMIPYLSFFAVEILILWIVLGIIQTFVLFAFPLIVEYKLSGMAAFKLSAKAVWNNLGGIIGFVALEVAMIIIGYALCLVGVYLMLPIMFAGALVVYRKVFPSSDNFSNIPSNIPPSPSAYQNAGSYN